MKKAPARARRFSLWRVEIDGEVHGFVANGSKLTRDEAANVFMRTNPKAPKGVLALRAVRSAKLAYAA